MKDYIVGRETIAMFARGSTWGEPAAGSQGLLFEDASLQWNQQSTPLHLANSYWTNHTEQGPVRCSLEITQPFFFNDLRGLTGALGNLAYDGPAEINTGAGDYKHQIRPSTSIEGCFFTLAMQRAEGIFNVYPSCKLTGFEISGTVDPNRLKIKYYITADTMINHTAGIDPALFTSLQYPSDKQAYFKDCNFYLNGSETSQLDESDKITNLVSGFRFIFKRSMTMDYTNSSGLQIEEPLDDAAPEIKLELSLAYKDAFISRLFDGRGTASMNKMLLEITGGPASPEANSEKARVTLKIPNLLVTNDNYAEFSGMDRQKSEVSFTALAKTKTSVPGMDFDEPFMMEIVNNQQYQV
jgi:hypothetical protein